jgi:hypothetical protein
LKRTPVARNARDMLSERTARSERNQSTSEQWSKSERATTEARTPVKTEKK